MNVINEIIRYEQGELDESEEINLFQRLVDDLVIFQLQGNYIRRAQQLINEGQIIFKTSE